MNGTKSFLEEEINLSKFQLFSNLSPEELIHLNIEGTYLVYTRNETVYLEGSRLKGFYLVLRGILNVYKTGRNGEEQNLRFAKCGEIIGYHSIICQEPENCSVRAIEESVLCHIPYSTVMRLLQYNRQFSGRILQIACEELNETNKRLTSIAQKKAKENLAEILLVLKQKFDPDDANVLQIPLSREELASTTGNGKETVIRILSEFRRDKLIEIKKGRIKLLDIPKIKVIASL